MILIVDNFDSFVHNLARYVRQLTSVPVQVVRNDQVDVRFVQEQDVEAMILSPGPCGPQEAGDSLSLVREFYRTVPMLGVFLGHQVIAEALGCKIVRANEPQHGKPSQIIHVGQQNGLSDQYSPSDQNGGSRLFDGVPSPFTAGRYHSLSVERDSVSDLLSVTAWTSDESVMAIEHADFPVFGVQFHPESVLTEHGYQIIHNFLRAAGIDSKIPQSTECVG